VKTQALPIPRRKAAKEGLTSGRWWVARRLPRPHPRSCTPKLASGHLGSRSSRRQGISRCKSLNAPRIPVRVRRNRVGCKGSFEPFGTDWQANTMAGASDNGLYLRLPGQWDDGTWDGATSGSGVNYNVHRWYQPGTGRYTRPDPIGLIGSINLYGYVEQNPVMKIDPLGLATLGIGGRIINRSNCCVLVSENAPIQGQQQFQVKPHSSSGSRDVDAIYFNDGGALKIPDGSVYVIYDCNSLNSIPADHSPCLSVLKPSCSLTLDRGESIPPEAEDRVVLQALGVRRIVKKPEDLAGCVSLNSPQDAIEYLRFFSSWKTVHLFRDQMLEVFEGEKPAYEYGPKGTCYLCLPPNRWRALGLASPKVIVEPGGYLVTRFVVRPSPADSNVSDLYRITQRVSHNGSVSLVDEEPIPGLTRAERFGLAFPLYL